MLKGECFLEYTDDYYSTTHTNGVGAKTATREIKLSDTSEIDESDLVEKAKAKWDEVISQYPQGVKKVPLGGWRSEPRNPRIVLRIKAEFPEGPKKTEMRFAKHLL